MDEYDWNETKGREVYIIRIEGTKEGREKRKKQQKEEELNG